MVCLFSNQYRQQTSLASAYLTKSRQGLLKALVEAPELVRNFDSEWQAPKNYDSDSDFTTHFQGHQASCPA